jgi:hypothetical protein
MDRSELCGKEEYDKARFRVADLSKITGKISAAM